jgi:cyclopropane fatty-acyl-phospholipid synthase-like methyltransferase
MATDQDRIRSYYSRFGEWERLDAPEGAVEFRRACSLLDAHLPPGSRVLDLGGGPGRYAIKLAMDGHHVVLADMSATLLEAARQRIAQLGPLNGVVEAIDEVNAIDLSRYSESVFDAVVAFGPFYHLVSGEERLTAASEVWRVLRAKGLAFVAFIPRLSGVAGLLERAAMSPEQVPEGTLTTTATTGVFRNASTSGFQEGYYPTLGEMQALFAGAGFEIVDAVSLRSIASRLEAKMARLQVSVVAEVEQLMEDLGRDPAVIAAGGHAVLVARKP